MAEATVVAQPEKAKPARRPVTAWAVVVTIVAWLVPGGGHFLLKRWIRGGLLLLSVATMFVLGILMQGKVYSPNTGDILDMLGFVGDLGAGLFYIVTRMMDWGRGSINLATADYGTKYIVVAGLLNVIAAVDAYHIAIGEKP
ncbi:MAG TPA: DUF6677 family protein [Terriglobales bacterium]|nr:DUF6677 family protein [Terriglobales bacterium]